MLGVVVRLIRNLITLEHRFQDMSHPAKRREPAPRSVVASAMARPVVFDPDIDAKKAAARAYALSSGNGTARRSSCIGGGGQKKSKKKTNENGESSNPRVPPAAAQRSAVKTGNATGASTRSRSKSEGAAVAEAAASLLGASGMPLAVSGAATGSSSPTAKLTSAPPSRGQHQQNNFDLLATAASQSQPSTPAKPHGFGGAERGATAKGSAEAGVAPARGGEGALDNDDEYAKFVRSLCQHPVLGPDDDLASLISRGGGGVGAPTDDEDDGGSYQLQSDEDDDDDDDELVSIILGRDNDEDTDSQADEDNNEGDEVKITTSYQTGMLEAAASMKVNSIGGTTVYEDSDAAKSSSKLATPTNKEATGTRSLNLYSEGANSPVSIDHNLNIMAELEAELSMLMEEDMDAAVSTLLGGHFVPTLTTSSPNNAVASSGQAAPRVAKAKAPTMNAAPRTSKGQPPSIAPSRPTVPTVPVGGKTQSTPNRSSGVKGAGDLASVSNPPQTPKANAQLPTSGQIIELRNLMSSHYQLLLQQSVLAVRSANLYRHQKGDCGLASGRAYSRPEGPLTSSVNAASGLVSAKEGGPIKEMSRGDNPVLEPSDFFFCGESAEDLAEILDGAVGMLQDLDEVRLYLNSPD